MTFDHDVTNCDKAKQRVNQRVPLCRRPLARVLTGPCLYLGRYLTLLCCFWLEDKWKVTQQQEVGLLAHKKGTEELLTQPLEIATPHSAVVYFVRCCCSRVGS